MHYMVRPCKYLFKVDAHTTPLPLLPQHPISQHTRSDMLRLYSPATSSGKTRQLLQWALPNSPPISSLFCWLTWSATTYWPEMTPLCPIDLDVLCEHLLECLLSFHPSNSIQQLLILLMSTQVSQVWHCVCHLDRMVVWIMSECQDATKEQLPVSIYQFQLTLL